MNKNQTKNIFIVTLLLFLSTALLANNERLNCPKLIDDVNLFCQKNNQEQCFKYALCSQRKSPEKVEKIFDSLCRQKNHLESCLILAVNETRSNPSRAIKKIKNLCDKNLIMACQNILMHNSDFLSDIEIKEIHQKLKNIGIDSYFEIGIFKYRKKKSGLGLEELKVSCTNGNTRACAVVSQIYAERDPDGKELINHLGVACEKTKGGSCSRLGFIYLRKNDFEKAMKYFNMVCKDKLTFGCAGKGGVEYKMGKWKSALESFRKSCVSVGSKECKIFNDFKNKYSKQCSGSKLESFCLK